MGRKGIYILLIAVFAFIGLTASTWNQSVGTLEAFLEGKAEIFMREIGHQTLLYAGDSTSRVLPVDRLAENIFQIPFEKEFSFAPDTLVKIVDRSFSKANIPLAYRVSVFDCTGKKMVYGFEIAQLASIVPCQGRVQPKGCYTLQVAFLDQPEKSNTNTAWFGASAAILALLGFVLTNRKREKLVVADTPILNTGVKLGAFQFYPERRLLVDANEKTELSDKETRILNIFATRQNQPVDREEIMKEVWENEGVIVGRSLDVFVSKLRKRLQKDPSLRIVNIHGKGYKLEVD
jgi:LPXTG-motif cell wall-anchored protein